MGWENESRYEVLLQVPDVRDFIERNAAQVKTGMSGEEFLELCDLALEPLVGVSLSKVAKIAVPIYSSLGIHTGKTRCEVLSAPIGIVLVATLCSLARYGRSLKRVHQGSNGCVLVAAIPSDIWSWEGELVITVGGEHSGTMLDAVAKISGQLFDWGKSKQCVDQLYEDVKSFLD